MLRQLLLLWYQAANTYTDSTAVGGTTYYYTVHAGNYGRATNSEQVAGTPTAAAAGWRYLKVEGYGSSYKGQELTTRMIEVEAWVGLTNVLSGLKGISYAAINAGSTDIKTVTNGVKTITTNSYPIWWTATPNANVVFDLGSSKALTKLNYYAYSISGDQRAYKFKILASNTNNGTDWVTLWDMSTNTTVQTILPSGYEKTL